MTDKETAELAAKQAADKEVADKAAADAAAQDDDDTSNDDAGAGDDAGDGDEDAESEQLKADLEKERAAREKAEKALAKQAYDTRKGRRATADDAGAGDGGDGQATDDDDRPLSRKEYKELREQDRKLTLTREAETLAANMSTNPTMRDLIIEKWKNRSFPADLTLQEQIEECYLAANKKRILGENNELKRALRGKNGINRDASGSQQDVSANSSAPKLPANDAREIARLGFKWNPTVRRFEKTLSNGNMIVKDQKTGATSLIRKA